jgi:tetratricopeptide (TPR) repeat protein
MRRVLGVLSISALALTGALACAPGETAPSQPAEQEPAATRVEATSLLGTPLQRPTFSPEQLGRLIANRDEAQARFDASPEDEDAIIWLGRRTAYLGHYNDAIDIYTRGIERLPESHRLFRHRGHRYISLRRFDDAVADLRRAAELSEGVDDQIEQDGIPNSIGQPLSTTKFNIWYHLALAHYLRGEFELALTAYERCMQFSDNPDLLVATSDWMYMTLRRLGHHDEARALLEPISADMEIVENDAYHRRLLMYKGEMAPEDLLDLRSSDDPDMALNVATQGYGVGNWFLVEGDAEQAREIFQRIVEGSSWAAFGFIAAEADLARMPPLE